MEEDFAALHRIDTAPPPVIAASKGTPAAAAPRTLATSASLTKLEPFILLAKSTKGAGAAALVDRVISASGVYTFTEFLQLKSIQELAHTGHKNKFFLLEIFAYGTLKDYRDNAASLPELSKAQLFKLKQLTLVDLASQDRSLPYPLLMQTLEISSIRRLEELIVECIYSDLIVGRINQKKQVLEVDHVVLGRDVRLPTTAASGSSQTQPSIGPNKDIAHMMQVLHAWYARVGDTLGQLDSHINMIRQQEANKVKMEEYQNDKVHKVMSEISRAAAAKSTNKARERGQAQLTSASFGGGGGPISHATGSHRARGGNSVGGHGAEGTEASYEEQVSAAIAASMADMGGKVEHEPGNFGALDEEAGMQVDEGAQSQDRSKRSPGKALNRKRTRQ